MKNVKLSVKLIGSFVIVAVITLAVGFVGWQGVGALSQHLTEIGDVRLPSIQSLLIVEKEGESIRVAQRTLLNPDLSREDNARQFKNIAKARDRYQEAWKIYEPLPQTPEEAVLWKKFVPAWDAWRQENNAFLKIMEELNGLDVGNPMAMRELLAEIRGDHYKVMSQVAVMVSDGVVFEGSEDHTACKFGRWQSTFKTENTKLKTAIAQISEPHKHFHQLVAQIKTRIKEGNLDEAQALFKNEMVPTADKVFDGLRILRKESEKAEALYEKAVHYAMVTAREKQVTALGYLHEIIKINEEVAASETKEADAVSKRSKLIALAGMVVGFFAALAFGILLSISISRKLKIIIDGLNEGAEQVASASSQVSTASQSLAEGASEQAASIEETSSSLEEMSSMTRQNADNATQAD
ncbi:MAG: MCP four helix bundle domain-containing protein, partial [Pseudomonadota bacterium]